MSSSSAYLKLVAQADASALIRLVPSDQPADRLPESADSLVGPLVSRRGRIARPVALILASLFVVWFCTVNAWDTSGGLPWFWNPVWLIVPWFFVGPFWGFYIASLVRARRDRPLREAYAEARRTSLPAEGELIEMQVSRSDDGSVTACAVRISLEAGDVVTRRLAPAGDVLVTELPLPGDTAHVWHLAGRIVVQCALRDQPARRTAPA